MSTRWALLVLTAGILSGCNGSGGSADTAPRNTPLVVQPALGQVFNGKVELLSVKGEPIRQGELDDQGRVELSVPSDLPAPFLVQVCGGKDVSYFDEALQAKASLPDGFCLRALSPDNAQRTLAISVLSEAVVRYFEQHGGLASVNAATLRTTYAEFAAKLAVKTDIGILPARIGDKTALDALAGHYMVDSTPVTAATETGGDEEYAYRLASLARIAQTLATHRGVTLTTPALLIADKLADDLAADGVLDGRDARGYILSPAYDGLQLNNLLAFDLHVQLGEQYGSELAAADLTTQTGKDLLLARHLRLPAVLPIARATPDDSLLSWQGRYMGTWHLGGNIDIGRQYASFLPPVYQNYMSQLVEGNPCVVDITDEAISINGLPFAINLLTRIAPDPSGQRLYAVQRDDSAILMVHAAGNLVTRNGDVQAVRFDVKAGLGPFMLDAQVACEVAP